MKLQVGQVFHLWCSVCNPQKYKFYVVALTTPLPRFFLINSNPTPFQQARPHLLSSLVSLEEASEAFLSHDSVLDCTEILGGFTADELERAHVTDSSILRGRLCSKNRAKVRAVLTVTKLISERDREALLKVW